MSLNSVFKKPFLGDFSRTAKSLKTWGFCIMHCLLKSTACLIHLVSLSVLITAFVCQTFCLHYRDEGRKSNAHWFLLWFDVSRQQLLYKSVSLELYMNLTRVLGPHAVFKHRTVRIYQPWSFALMRHWHKFACRMSASFASLKWYWLINLMALRQPDENCWVNCLLNRWT